MRKSDRVEANRALLQSALIALRKAQTTKTVHKIRAELDGDALDYEIVKGHELPYLTSDVWRVLRMVCRTPADAAAVDTR